MIQKVKIAYENAEVFFFDHSFKTAHQHADDFVKRNKGKFAMRMFNLNTSDFGEQWLLEKVIKVDWGARYE